MTLKHAKDLKSKQTKESAKPLKHGAKAEKAHFGEAKPIGKSIKKTDKTKVPGKKKDC